MFPASTLIVETESFIGISAQVVIVPEGCKSIESKAFVQCGNLQYMVISESDELIIADDALDNGITLIYR